MARRRSWIRYLLAAVVAAASVAAIAFGLYLLQLDREVRTRFAGARWALPAQLYAAPMDLYKGLRLSQQQFRGELERLGYRLVQRLDGPGTFSSGPGRIDVHTRAFRFWDGLQGEKKLRLNFSTDSVIQHVSGPPGNWG